MDTTASAKRVSFDTAAVWALGLTFLFAVIAFIPSATIPFLYTKTSLLVVGAIVTLGLFILARLTRGNIVVPSSYLLPALWVVPLAYALSTLFSGVNIHTAFFGTELEADTLGFVILVALLGTLTAVVLRRRQSLEFFYLVGAGTFALVFIAQAVFIVLGQVMPDKVSASANIVGSFEDLGIMAGLYVTMALLAFRFLVLPSRMRLGMMVVGAIAVLTLALVNAFSLWMMVGLVALGLFIEAIMSRGFFSNDEDLEGVSTVAATSDGSREDSRSLLAPLVVLVLSLFFVISGSTIGTTLASALNADVLNVRPSWSSTVAVGGHTYASSPVFGTGPGTFGEQWLLFRDQSINETLFWTIDFTSGVGYVPTSFVTTGAFGALAWVAFFALLLFFGIRFLLMKAPTDAFMRFVSLSSFTGAIYLFALSIFTVPGPVPLTLAFILVGVFISSMRYGVDARELGVAFTRSPRVGFLIVFVLTLILLASVMGIYVVVERYLASVSYAQAASALSAGRVDEAKTALARSILFAPSDRAYRLSSVVGVARLNQIANDATLTTDQARTEFQATLSTAVSDALTSTQLGPKNYQNWAALGSVYGSVVSLGIEGARDNAKTAYEQAATLNPTNAVIPYVIAQLEIASKNIEGAETYLTQAITLKRNYTEAIFLLSQLKVQVGEAKEALEAAEAAAYFAPSDPVVLFQVGLLRLGTGDVDGAIAALTNATIANAEYANAHYFLAVAFAQKKDYPSAVKALEMIATFSPENADAVAKDIESLKANKNPFPATTFANKPINEPAVTSPTQ